MKLILYLASIIILLIFGMLACSDAEETVESTSAGSTPTPKFTSKPVATIDPSVIPDLPEITPTPTHTPVATAALNVTPTPLITNTPEPTLVSDLDGTEWQLLSYNGESPLDPYPVSLSFYNGNMFRGSAGCGFTYFTYYSTVDNAFYISDNGLTVNEGLGYCKDEVYEQIDTYFSLIENVNEYQYNADHLVLKNNNESITLSYKLRNTTPTIDPALEGTQWKLVFLNGIGLIENTYISMQFRDGGISGNAGCNNYGSTIIRADEGIFEISGGSITLGGCSEAIVNQERAYSNALNSSTAYVVSDGVLQLSNNSKDIALIFEQIDEFQVDPTELVGTEWQLIKIDEQDVANDLGATLKFDSEIEATGRGGCCSYTLYYVATGDNINCGVRAKGSCSNFRNDLASEQGSIYCNSLIHWANYRLGNGYLEILTSRGQSFLFDPIN